MDYSCQNVLFACWLDRGLIHRCNQSEFEVLVERFLLAKGKAASVHEVNLKLKREPDARLIWAPKLTRIRTRRWVETLSEWETQTLGCRDDGVLHFKVSEEPVVVWKSAELISLQTAEWSSRVQQNCIQSVLK